MRRVMLLALLALALPMAALASSIFDTGPSSATGSTIATVNPSGGLSAGTFSVTVKGSMFTFELRGSPGSPIMLSSGCVHGAAGGTCTFNTGILTVTNSTGVVFMDSIQAGSGSVTMGAATATGTAAVIHAVLNPDPTVFIGTPDVSFGITFKGGAVNNILPQSRGVVSGTPIPEPGTLGLLGSGLFGLAGLARRKLKLPT